MNAAEDRAPAERSIDELVRGAMPDQVPPEVQQRLREQLVQFRAPAVTAPLVGGGRTFGSPTWWGLGLTAAAIIGVGVTISLLWQPKVSFGEVVRALGEQPWVHVHTKSSTGRESDTWYSAPRQIVASRGDRQMEYRDHRLGVFHQFDVKENVLYRLPEYRRSGTNQYETLATAMSSLLSLGRKVDDPLVKLFPAQQKDPMKILDQSVEKVSENGHAWLDYRLTVSHPELGEPMKLLIRVDADTKLPRLFRKEGVWKGERVVDDATFDYPDEGPADIYALGIPASAKLVDRVPTGELKRIREALAAGRERMDDYRAVFVSETEGADPRGELPMIWYRKGQKLRADYVLDWKGDLLDGELPAKDEDLGAWWRKRVHFFRWYPQYITADGIQYSTEQGKNADGTSSNVIVKVRSNAINSLPGESSPPEYSMRPEYAVRPLLGFGSQSIIHVVDEHPAAGPADCVLLTMRRTTKEGGINAQGMGLPDEWRYWLDPKRDYIAMRWDMMRQDQAGKLQIHSSAITEQVARSPQGVWYATRIRTIPHWKTPEGEQVTGSVYQLYVDFDVKLPDSLFNPPRLGKIEGDEVFGD